MSIAIKTLASGTLGTTSQAALYTVPPSTTAMCRIELANTNLTTTIKVNLYVDGERIAPRDLELEAQDFHRTGTEWLSAGNVVQGDAATASQIDFRVVGFERS